MEKHREECSRFARVRPTQLIPMSSLDKETYLTIIVDINHLPKINSYIENFIKVFEEHLSLFDEIKKESKRIFVYPWESRHFTLLPIASYSTPTDIKDIKNLIGNNIEKIEEVIEREKPIKFNVFLKFVSATPESAFFVVSSAKESRDNIREFQKNVVEESKKVLKGLDLNFDLGYKQDTQDCFPINFLRWRIEGGPDNLPNVLGEIEREYIKNPNQEADYSDEVKRITLIYSNKFCSPKQIGREVIQEFNLSK